MASQVSAQAIIAFQPEQDTLNWKLQDVTLRDLGPEEVLVRMVATGICHTDVVFGLAPLEVGGPYPKVLGHEGAGYVERCGSDVKDLNTGDSVLMSFVSCSNCKDCKDGHPSYCQSFSAFNYGGDQGVFTTSDGSKTSGMFFGQSSFSNLAIVKASSIVNVSSLVKNEEELKLFAPLGCGFQTGFGTVTELCGAGDKDTIVVIGLGGVGLTAIMAAKFKKCKTIIGIDRFPERLDLGTSVGATHVINTSDMKEDLVAEIKQLTDGLGPSITVDTTGNMELIGNGMDFTANRGQMTILGVPPLDGFLSTHLVKFMQTGKSLRGSIEGDVTPSDFIPRMIQWYREGNMPIESLIKYYPVAEFNQAVVDMHTGVAVKPVLIW